MESHLLQMRGLKPLVQKKIQKSITSHLLQMRGLKPLVVFLNLTILCRIFYRCVD